MIAAGVGCRSGVEAAAIVELVERAFAAAGLDAVRRRGAVLFTLEARAGEPGLVEAAARLGLPLRPLPHAALAAVADRAVTRSPRVAAATGLPSVAETAALAGAGPGARLLLPRLASARATCALAQPETPT